MNPPTACCEGHTLFGSHSRLEADSSVQLRLTMFCIYLLFYSELYKFLSVWPGTVHWCSAASSSCGGAAATWWCGRAASGCSGTSETWRSVNAAGVNLEQVVNVDSIGGKKYFIFFFLKYYNCWTVPWGGLASIYSFCSSWWWETKLEKWNSVIWTIWGNRSAHVLLYLVCSC